jgi:hypothetical protein
VNQLVTVCTLSEQSNDWRQERTDWVGAFLVQLRGVCDFHADDPQFSKTHLGLLAGGRVFTHAQFFAACDDTARKTLQMCKTLKPALRLLTDGEDGEESLNGDSDAFDQEAFDQEAANDNVVVLSD